VYRVDISTGWELRKPGRSLEIPSALEAHASKVNYPVTVTKFYTHIMNKPVTNCKNQAPGTWYINLLVLLPTPNSTQYK
jgi:hypothetical protein